MLVEEINKVHCIRIIRSGEDSDNMVIGISVNNLILYIYEFYLKIEFMPVEERGSYDIDFI
jgi:hypothetical protein